MVTLLPAVALPLRLPAWTEVETCAKAGRADSNSATSDVENLFMREWRRADTRRLPG
jgi:hypothetical protein